MLNVIVCEDNNVERSKITQIIKNTIVRYEMDMKIQLSTGNVNDVLVYLYKNNSTGIYFLDVDLKSKINGIALAERIRKYDPNAFVVFVTTHAEMSFLTFEYKVEAMDYIIKDDFDKIKKRIVSCIQTAYERYHQKTTKNKSDKIFDINLDDKIISIKYKDILFFETSQKAHKVRVHEFNRQLEFYGTLKEIEKKLDDRFYKCHRSYVVNVDNIKTINKKDRVVVMKNNEECFVSVRYLKGLIKLKTNI